MQCDGHGLCPFGCSPQRARVILPVENPIGGSGTSALVINPAGALADLTRITDFGLLPRASDALAVRVLARYRPEVAAPSARYAVVLTIVPSLSCPGCSRRSAWSSGRT